MTVSSSGQRNRPCDPRVARPDCGAQLRITVGRGHERGGCASSSAAEQREQQSGKHGHAHDGQCCAPLRAFSAACLLLTLREHALERFGRKRDDRQRIHHKLLGIARRSRSLRSTRDARPAHSGEQARGLDTGEQIRQPAQQRPPLQARQPSPPSLADRHDEVLQPRREGHAAGFRR